jgi:hypothetical protein
MPVTVAVLSLVHVKVVPAILLVNTMVVIGLAEQMVCEAGAATAFGFGFTRTVAVIGRPWQVFAEGVIVNVTRTGANVVLVSVPLISPLPLAAMPVTVPALSLVQLKFVPATLPVKTIGAIGLAEQMVCEAGNAVTSGVGFTRTVAVIGRPWQVFADGVMVNVTRMGANVVLVSVPLISPLPLAAIPVTVTVLLRVQLKVVPSVLLVNTIVVIGLAEQMVCEAGVAMASGVGFTRTVAVMGNPGHPLAVGVIVNVTKTGAKVVLVSVPLIFPLPLAAMPVTANVLFLVQLKAVPATLPVKTMGKIGLPEQMVCEAGNAVASGVGFTVTTTSIGVPVHPLAVGVIV